MLVSAMHCFSQEVGAANGWVRTFLYSVMRCVVRKLGEDASLKDAFNKHGKLFKGESILLVEPFADERQNAAHVEFESVAHGDIFAGNLQHVEDDM